MLEAVLDSQTVNPSVNVILVRIAADADPNAVAAEIRRWKRLQVYTRAEMNEILQAKLIAIRAALRVDPAEAIGG